MAEQKVDDRGVKKIRAAIAQDGLGKAAQRFDEDSPEWQKAQQERAKLKAAGAEQRARILRAAETNQKEGKTMTSTPPPGLKPSPAQERSSQAQRAAAQQKVQEMRRQQAAQNARRQTQSQDKSKSRGMGT